MVSTAVVLAAAAAQGTDRTDPARRPRHRAALRRAASGTSSGWDRARWPPSRATPDPTPPGTFRAYVLVLPIRRGKQQYSQIPRRRDPGDGGERSDGPVVEFEGGLVPVCLAVHPALLRAARRADVDLDVPEPGVLLLYASELDRLRPRLAWWGAVIDPTLAVGPLKKGADVERDCGSVRCPMGVAATTAAA